MGYCLAVGFVITVNVNTTLICSDMHPSSKC